MTDMEPASVFWIVPLGLAVDAEAAADIFAGAWQRSSWRDTKFLLHVVPEAPGAGYAILAQLQHDAHVAHCPYTLLLAADSLLDAVELAPDLALDKVFSDAAPLGFIPAEGAAGLLLFDTERSAHELWANAPVLAAVQTVELRPDLTAREAAAVLSETMGLSMSAAAHGGDGVKLLVSDNDHRLPGKLSVIKAMASHMAHLDPLEDRLSPMEYAGSFGAAGDVIHLALAIEIATENSQPVCSVCNAANRVASVLVLPA